MEKTKYQQLYNLKGKLESYIQKSLISSKKELDNSKKEIEKLESELKQYREASKEKGIEETYTYAVKTGELSDKIYELKKKIHKLQEETSVYVSLEGFCEFLSNSLKTPADVISSILKGGYLFHYILEDINEDIKKYQEIINKYSDNFSYEEEIYNAHIKSYNLTGCMTFDEKDFLRVGNSEAISQLSVGSDPDIDDFYLDVVTGLGFYNRDDIEKFYDKDISEMNRNSYICYLYTWPEDIIIKRSKIIGVTIDKFTNAGIKQCYPHGNCIGRVLGKIINKEVDNIDKYSILLDSIIQRVLPILKNIEQEDLDWGVLGDTIEHEQLKLEIEKLKEEFPEFSSYAANYIDEDTNIKDNKKK